jgi:hypothetical protein
MVRVRSKANGEGQKCCLAELHKAALHLMHMQALRSYRSCCSSALMVQFAGRLTLPSLGGGPALKGMQAVAGSTLLF